MHEWLPSSPNNRSVRRCLPGPLELRPKLAEERPTPREEPLLSQRDYDHLLWSCDLNFVRGEDSLVRALWAGNPFVWNIYPQEDDAHRAKLSAFLDWLGAPGSLRDFHSVWNGAADGPLPPAEAQAWAGCIRAARQRLLTQEDLVTQLLAFAASQSAPS